VLKTKDAEATTRVTLHTVTAAQGGEDVRHGHARAHRRKRVSVSDIIRESTIGAVATLAKEHETRGRMGLLAQSAEDLLERMERLRGRGPTNKLAVGMEQGAICQWVVDLAFRLVKCDYVAVARIHDLAHAAEPLAEAGRLTRDRREWWDYAQNRVLAARRAYAPEDMQPAGEALVLDLPQRETRRAARTQRSRIACVIPLYVAGELAAVFAFDVRGASLPLSGETITLARGMASAAAIALEGIALRTSRSVRELTALREAVAEMDAALSLVSHELKGPLTTILGCLQLVGQQVDRLTLLEPSSAENEKALASIQERMTMATRSAQVVERLANDLVEASRLHNGKMSIHPTICDLGQLVRDAVGGQRAVSHRIIHLEAPMQAIRVFADPDRIAQVVANFLGNALKYSPKTEPVEVVLEVLKTKARVSVRDYGPGLEKSELRRIWRRFYRVGGVPVHNATGSGLGLGLYIAGEIIRGHGGKFGVESAPGHGSTFWFTLPLARPW
jgi:signal transduction histidine kinase